MSINEKWIGPTRRVPLYLQLQYYDVSSARAALMVMNLFVDEVFNRRVPLQGPPTGLLVQRYKARMKTLELSGRP
jgi:hypothetical protein